MLILLIPATFIAVFLSLCGYHASRRTPLADWRMSVLQAATLMGGYMVLFSELLSLFNSLNTLWVTIFWGAALAFFDHTRLANRMDSRKDSHSLKNGWKKPEWFDILAGSITAIILVIAFHCGSEITCQQ